MEAGDDVVRRRQRRVVVACALVLVVGTALLVGWPTYASHVAAGVRVTWAGEPVCQGTRVVHEPDPFGDVVEQDDAWAPRIPMIVAAPGMRCVVTLHVSNESSRAVTIRTIEAQSLGPASGGLIQAQRGTLSPAETYPGDDRAALYRVDERLRAHDEMDLDQITIVYRPSGCWSAGGTFALERWPELSASVLGRTVRVRSDDDLVVRAPGRYGNIGTGCSQD